MLRTTYFAAQLLAALTQALSVTQHVASMTDDDFMALLAQTEPVTADDISLLASTASSLDQSAEDKAASLAATKAAKGSANGKC